MNSKGKISIVGSGLIGRSWAMLFASVGYDVAIYDNNEDVIQVALKDIQSQLNKLEISGLLRGSLTAEQQFSLIKGSDSLEECVKNSLHVQESVFEKAELKKEIFEQLDNLVSNDTTLSSSTSCVTPSSISKDLRHRAQVIVAHPANPPYYVPIVEIVPAPWTDSATITKTIDLMKEIGQKPVLCKKEMYGFVINRMQYSLINECWRLVRDGVISVEDIDAVMSEGLGMRYAFLGVLETCHLNADGMLDYAARYGKGIYDVSETFGDVPKMEGQVAKEINDQLCQMVPNDKIAERRKWRDDRLANLAQLKQYMNKRDEIDEFDE